MTKFILKTVDYNFFVDLMTKTAHWLPDFKKLKGSKPESERKL